ncbi:MAG: DUF2059 domain-containing protein [Chitinophagaceae bacterium]|nr:MAG: DUF2059 domain-containing protein [Chitinophagaceae bacterium]
MKKIILLSALFIFSINTFSQTTTNQEHVKSLLEVMGSGKLGVQMMENLIAVYKKSLPEVPDQFWKEFMSEVNSDTLINLMVPIYSKHFTDEEVVGLIEFYKGPLGKKIVEKIPLITQESYMVGEAWGKKLSEQAIKKLVEKGYISADEKKE